MKVKNPEIDVGGKKFLRIPVKTHVITRDDSIVDVVKKYALPEIKKNDIVFISEKAVAITQGRAYPVKDIKPGRLAVFLSGHVTKTPNGIGAWNTGNHGNGLEGMRCNKDPYSFSYRFCREASRKKGDFYRVAGYKASSIRRPDAKYSAAL